MYIKVFVLIPNVCVPPPLQVDYAQTYILNSSSSLESLILLSFPNSVQKNKLHPIDKAAKLLDDFSSHIQTTAKFFHIPPLRALGNPPPHPSLAVNLLMLSTLLVFSNISNGMPPSSLSAAAYPTQCN